MDGIEELNGVTVLAATNRPEVIVSALVLRTIRTDGKRRIPP
jgi:SpoVK/Ycf46/Vps4 family AAA+-type ATPase